MRLADLAWPAVRDRAATSLLAIPLGSTEQHGPHLPVSTDTDIAVALASGLASARDDVLVAPAVAYGSSGEHAGFEGTLSIGQDAAESTFVELVRSADAFRGVILVSGHGGNAVPLRNACARLSDEGRRVLAWSPRTNGDLHAGRVETSLMLALDPARVAITEAAAGDTRPLSSLLVSLVAGGVASVSPNGVLGDPAGASAGEGAALLSALIADLVAKVASWLR